MTTDAPTPLTDAAILRTVNIYIPREDGSKRMVFELVEAAVCRDLERRLSALQADSRWIPVGERLPDVSGFYQIWDAVKRRCGILFYHDHRLVQMPVSMPVWTYSDEQPWNGYFTVGLEITHWMPLPAAPNAARKAAPEASTDGGRVE